MTEKSNQYGKITLYPWQEIARDRLREGLSKYQTVADCSACGTGKTFTALAVACDLGLSPLIIAPRAVHTAWRKAAADTGVPIRDVLTVERLRMGTTPWVSKDGKWTIPSGTLVLFDEAHRGISGATAQTGILFAKTKAFGIPVMLLSATLASSPLNMRTSGFLFGLHDFSLPKFHEFCRNNECEYVVSKKFWAFNRGPKGQAALKRLYAAIADRMHRVTIAEIPSFPLSVIHAQLFDLSADARKAIEHEYKIVASIPYREEIRDRVIKLKARMAIELHKTDILLELIDQHLEAGTSVAVLMSFKEPLRKLRDALEAKGIKVAYLDGDCKQEDRDLAMTQFQADERHVFLATLAAGGVGLSLHQTSPDRRPRASLITPSESGPEVTQALGRVRRAGGGKTTQTFVLCAGTVEEKIQEKMEAKIKSMETLMGSFTDGDLTI